MLLIFVRFRGKTRKDFARWLMDHAFYSIKQLGEFLFLALQSLYPTVMYPFSRVPDVRNTQHNGAVAYRNVVRTT